jgi:chromosome segregation ATPase
MNALCKNAGGYIEGTVTDMSKISVTKGEIVNLRTEIKKIVDTTSNENNKESWAGNRIAEINACIKLISSMQQMAKSMLDTLNKDIDIVRNRIASIPDNPNPEQRNLLTRLKSGLDLGLNVSQLLEQLTKWNGDSISNINTDVKNIVKAAGGGNVDPNADAAAAAASNQTQDAQSQQQPAAAAPAAESWNFF